jgi:hypothetical protein
MGSITDALGLVPQQAHARPIDSGGSSSGWTCVTKSPSKSAGDQRGQWKVDTCACSIEMVEFPVEYRALDGLFKL